MPKVTIPVGDDAAVIVNYGTADQVVVRGLNEINVPAPEAKTVEVDEFREKFARKYASGMSMGDLTFKGTWVKNDPGQRDLTRLKNSGETFTNVRLYINIDDFYAPDTLKDPRTGIQVAKSSKGSASKGGTIAYEGTLVPNGLLSFYGAHTDGAEGAFSFVSGDPDTITRAAGSFVDDGFFEGQTLLVEGATTSGNDGLYEITKVEALTLTLATSTSLTSEASITGTMIHGGDQE